MSIVCNNIYQRERIVWINPRCAETSLDPPVRLGDDAPLGHTMVDDMLDYLEGVPVAAGVAADPRGREERACRRAPEGQRDPSDVYAEFVKNVLPYTTGNIHPRFWGWVMGNGTPFGMLAEMLAAGMNPNVPGGEQSPAYVEHQVLAWLRDIMGFPEDASALLVSGCSQANLTCLAVARDARRGSTRRRAWRARRRVPVMYCSVETHNSVDKSAKVIGLGAKQVRKIRTGADYRIDSASSSARSSRTRRRGSTVSHRRERGHGEHGCDRRHRLRGGPRREVWDVAARRWSVWRDRGDIAGARAAA